MIATSNKRVAAVDFFIHYTHSDQYFCRVHGAGRQSSKDFAGRRLVDRFHLLVKVSGVNHPDFIGAGWISGCAANFGLKKEIVAFVKNQLLVSDISEAKFQP